MNPISLTIGDWSGDGHRQTSTVVYLCNRTRDEVVAAYQRGTEAIGYDMVADLCEEYEDGGVTREVVEAFARAGLDLLAMADDYSRKEHAGGEKLSVSEEMWCAMYLATVKAGDPGVVFEEVEDAAIDIGGYGLFT